MVAMSDLETHLNKLKKLGCILNHTGSTYICNPPPENTDIDYLVFCQSQGMFDECVDYLLSNDFDIDCGEHYQDASDNTFSSFSNKPINFIVTKNYNFAVNHRLATEHCKKENMLDKAERIKVFQKYLYGATND